MVGMWRCGKSYEGGRWTGESGTEAFGKWSEGSQGSIVSRGWALHTRTFCGTQCCYEYNLDIRLQTNYLFTGVRMLREGFFGWKSGEWKSTRAGLKSMMVSSREETKNFHGLHRCFSGSVKRHGNEKRKVK